MISRVLLEERPLSFPIMTRVRALGKLPEPARHRAPAGHVREQVLEMLVAAAAAADAAAADAAAADGDNAHAHAAAAAADATAAVAAAAAAVAAVSG